MLPCKLTVQQINDGVEFAAIDPAASMLAVDNESMMKGHEMMYKKKKVIIIY